MSGIEATKQLFIDCYTKTITRPGAEKLLDYLVRSDFFSAPASTRFHLSVEGGLCNHSLNVNIADQIATSVVEHNYKIHPL